MSDSWTINGHSFASLEIANATLDFVAAGVDKATLRGPVATWLANPQFAYDELVEIKLGNERFFTGRCATPMPSNASARQYIDFELAGPWSDLQRITYRQQWTTWHSGSQALTAQWTPRVILGQDASGAAISVGNQIAAALDYAISRGANLQRESSVGWCATIVPFTEAHNVMVADVIVQMLKPFPDLVFWFDHSTSPPTARLVAESAMAAYTVNPSNASTSTRIRERRDLVVRGITVDFMREMLTNVLDPDGEGPQPGYTIASRQRFTQTAGDVDAMDAQHFVIELAGGQATVEGQTIETEEFPSKTDPEDEDKTIEDLDNVAWWKARVPWLADIQDANLEITGGARDHTDLPRILISGQIQEWMSDLAERCTVTAKVSYSKLAGAEVVAKVAEKIITWQCIVTDATSKTYRRKTAESSCEAAPEGFAAALYASWSKLYHEGSINLKTAAATRYTPGKLLRLTGRSDWASMHALLQRVSYDLFAGSCTLLFGPPAQITPDSLLALMRHFRRKPTSWSHVRRTSGNEDDVQGARGNGGATPDSSASSGSEAYSRLVLPVSNETYTRKITLDPEIVTIEDADVDIRPRVIQICVDGEAKTAWFLMSEPY